MADNVINSMWLKSDFLYRNRPRFRIFSYSTSHLSFAYLEHDFMPLDVRVVFVKCVVKYVNLHLITIVAKTIREIHFT